MNEYKNAASTLGIQFEQAAKEHFGNLQGIGQTASTIRNMIRDGHLPKRETLNNIIKCFPEPAQAALLMNTNKVLEIHEQLPLSIPASIHAPAAPAASNPQQQIADVEKDTSPSPAVVKVLAERTTLNEIFGLRFEEKGKVPQSITEEEYKEGLQHGFSDSTQLDALIREANITDPLHLAVIRAINERLLDTPAVSHGR